MVTLALPLTCILDHFHCRCSRVSGYRETGFIADRDPTGELEVARETRPDGRSLKHHWDTWCGDDAKDSRMPPMYQVDGEPDAWTGETWFHEELKYLRNPATEREERKALLLRLFSSRLPSAHSYLGMIQFQ